MTLHEALVARTIDAAPELVEQLDKGRLRCYACGHQCPIPEGAAGVCKVRFNDQGRLRGHGTGKAGDERIVLDVDGSFDWGTTTVEITAGVSATKQV